VLKNRIALEFQNLPRQLDNLRKQIASETDAAKKKQAEDRLKVQEAYQEQLKETVADATERHVRRSHDGVPR
jgi:hypothetical protein